MTSFIAAGGSGRSTSVIPAVPAAASVTTIAFIRDLPVARPLMPPADGGPRPPGAPRHPVGEFHTAGASRRMDWASTPDRNLTACLQPDPSRADLHPMDLLYSLAESIFLFMDSGPGLPMTLLCLVIAGIPVTLLHELGHAIAAYRLLGSEVDVSIGTVGKVAEMRLGEVAVSVHALSGLSAPLGCSGRPRPACSTTSSGPRHSPAPSPS